MTKTFRVNNLSIGYDHPIVSGINCEAFDGDLIAIVGNNGAGKSTLLKTFCGKLKIIAGRIESDRSVSFTSRFQKSLPYLTVRDVLKLGRYRHTDFFNRIKEGDDEMINEALNVCAILEIANRPYDSLSDGTKQKVLNALNIVQGTDLMVFDEPLNFLDVPSRGEFLDRLKDYCFKCGKVAIISSHEWNLCAKKCPKIWGIDSDLNFVCDVNRQYLLDESRICRC